MEKKYKISFIIYGVILIFSILFTLLLWGASGHRIKLHYQHYLIAIFALASVSLLFIFPRIPTEMKQQKIISGVLCLVLLLVSLYFALQNLFIILTENLIAEFKVISTLFVGIFITAIVYLFVLIVMIIKQKRNE
jgi:predicted neutral ceramidase superfamily lipid hydrolase